MVMKIENYEGTADLFTFPHNPQVFDDDTVGNQTFTNIAYQKHHIAISGGGISPKTIVLTGHFDGSTKDANFRSLARVIHESYKLKKLYFASDKFYLGIGGQIKKTHSGGRTNFIDYVMTFQSLIGILLDNTQQTYTNGSTVLSNDGDVTTFIEEISGTITSGSSNITITDGFNNQITIPAASLTTGQTFTLKFIKMVDGGSGIYVSEYNYCEVNGSQIKTVSTTGGFGLIQLAADADIDDITVTNLDAGWTAKFRNGWSG